MVIRLKHIWHKSLLQVSLCCRARQEETRALELTRSWSYERLNKHYAKRFVETSHPYNALSLHAPRATHFSDKWRFVLVHPSDFLCVFVCGWLVQPVYILYLTENSWGLELNVRAFCCSPNKNPTKWDSRCKGKPNDIVQMKRRWESDFRRKNGLFEGGEGGSDYFPL